uniref:Uncharacterized protein n=1 Tax=Craspedostauros australis TaxID=1486917 RepID=A0A7R9ZJQ0_9STRA|mmetsp:Transcript_11370/g.31476  ORF Transcript_11370/g.31476 Transcript_11370/m.31476 type:complete len:542 (+) Transcript_11370:99-1724(+)
MPVDRGTGGLSVSLNVSLHEIDLPEQQPCQTAEKIPTDGTSIIGVPDVGASAGVVAELPDIACLHDSDGMVPDAVRADTSLFPFWYKFVGTGQRMTASTCNPGSFNSTTTIHILTEDDIGDGNGGIDGGGTMGSSCDSGTLQCVPEAAISALPCDGHMAVTWATEMDKQYFVLVQLEEGGMELDMPSSGRLVPFPRQGVTSPPFLPPGGGPSGPPSVVVNTKAQTTPAFALTVEPTAVNDRCESAIGPLPLDSNPRTMSTRSATRSLFVTGTSDTHSIDYPSCSNATADGRDLWFSVVGHGYDMIVSTCSIITQYPTQISLFTGDECDGLSCDDVAAFEGTCEDMMLSDNSDFNDVAVTRGSTVKLESTKDELYFIRVSGQSLQDDYGTLDLRIGLWNDICHRATRIELPTPSSPGTNSSMTISGTTEGARPHRSCAYTGVFHDASAAWYRVEGNGTRVHASTCGTDSPYPSRVTVFESEQADTPAGLGVDCARLGCTRSANKTLCGTHSESTWLAEESKTYFVVVQSLGFPFQLEVTVES